jgi:DNA gyrase subunit A
MAILRHFEASPSERAAYLKMSRAMRGEGEPEEVTDDAEEVVAAADLPQDRYAEMSASEQMILSVSANGYGKRTSSFEYRITRRGGKGIIAMTVNQRNGKLVASFPVEESDQIMLVTDRGQLIRIPVQDIRVVSRSTQGVIVFNTADDEHVVSVEHIPEVEGNGDAEDGENGDNGEDGTGEDGADDDGDSPSES